MAKKRNSSGQRENEDAVVFPITSTSDNDSGEAGALSYFDTLIENLESGNWTRNCPQDVGSKERHQ
jgi:hypothetical protein